MVAALAITSVWAMSPALADVIPPRAKALVVRGRAAHDAGDYRAAIIAFKEAYEIAPSAGLLFNLAQSYRLAGNCVDAASMYRRYLDAQPGTDGRTLALAHLATTERCARDGAAAPAPTRTPEGASPGPRRARADAAPVSLALSSDRASDAASSVAPRIVRARRERQIGATLVVTGALALVVAASYGFAARDAASSVEAAYARGTPWPQLADLDARGHRDAQLGTVVAVAGGAAAITGIALYLVGRRGAQLAPIAIQPLASGAHGVQVQLAWPF